MAKFVLYFKDNTISSKKLGEFKTKEAAANQGASEVGKYSMNEREQAKAALMQRGYYCMGWSDREVYIEEE